MNFGYEHQVEPSHSNAYLWPQLLATVESRDWTSRRAIDLGCGNGATAAMLAKRGWDVLAVDPSESGIHLAKSAHPMLKAEVADAYDDLATRFGVFPLVVSLEVVEHCFDPQAFAQTFVSLIAPGGIGFLSTPYHGYLKNVAIAVSGKMDSHFSPLWAYGHIKFFSIKTLRQLLSDAGAGEIEFARVGRWPRAFAKSLIAVVRR
jgi:2-polyprenyl-3-methyl-5-hydroxy-6-metoxy-1,4-benzoquinol methylase